MPLEFPKEDENTLPGFLDDFVDAAFAFARQKFGMKDVREAWSTFRVWMSESVDFQADDWRLFMAWYVFHWHADRAASPEKAQVNAEIFMVAQPNYPSIQKEILTSAVQSPLDFYEIYQLNEWECFYTKSLFLGLQHSFSFPRLPEGFRPGDIFFGKIVQVREDKGILVAHSPPLPNEAKVAIVQLRQDLIQQRKADFTQNFSLFDSDVFNLYYDLSQ